ncbi:MAG: type I-E CRISPR-associated protein Cas6/Cse3/CasE [Armatimonadota bacterium]
MSMYLSRVVLNPGHPDVRKALGNPYRLHQLLWRAFPNREDGGAGRVLFRVETLQSISTPVVLVQSDNAPDWSALGPLKTVADHREYNPHLATDQRLRFRLRANPTKRLSGGHAVNENGKMKDGPRVQLFGEEEQVDWLRRKGAQHGFTLLDCRVSSVETQRSRKAEGLEMRHQAVTFDGLLQVTDPAAFRVALEGGIGPGKGLGFGLLSIARG